MVSVALRQHIRRSRSERSRSALPRWVQTSQMTCSKRLSKRIGQRKLTRTPCTHPGAAAKSALTQRQPGWIRAMAALGRCPIWTAFQRLHSLTSHALAVEKFSMTLCTAACSS